MNRPLILIALALALETASAAEPENRYPDLTPEERQVADADNAWNALKALPAFRVGDVKEETWREAVRFLPQTGRKPKPYSLDAALVRKVAAENAELLEKLRAFHQRPAFLTKTLEPGEQETLTRDIKPWLGACNLNGLLATVEAGEGSFGEAWQDTLASAQTGLRMLQSGPNFFGMVVARSPVSLCSTWSLRAGSRAKASAPLKQRAADLAQFESLHELFAAGVKQEFLVQQKLLGVLRDGGDARRRLFVKIHLNSLFIAEVMEFVAREVERKKGEPKKPTPEPPGEKEESALMQQPPPEVLTWEAVSNATDWEGTEENLVAATRKTLSAPLGTHAAFRAALAEALQEEAAREAKEKAAAEKEATSTPPAITFEFSAAAAIHRQLCSASLQVRQTRIALALLAWELDNPGAPQLPASLDVLVPDYLPALPANPMNGEPIGYVPARRLLTGNWKSTDKEGKVTNNVADLPIPPLVR